MRSRACSLLAWFSMLAAPRLALAQQPVGAEFQVNLVTMDDQTGADIAFDAEGDFVVVWVGGPAGTFSTEILARRFAAGGTPQSPDLLVNSYTPGYQTSPAVAADASGGFVVVWASPHDGDSSGIFGQRFDQFGTRLGVEFQVNTFTAELQQLPDVARRSTGEFMVVWQSDRDGSGNGVFAQRFDAFGTKFGFEFQVNVYTPENQRRATVAFDSDASFVVIWDSLEQDGSSYGVFARRFNLFASPIGGEFQVSSSTAGTQVNGRIALDGDGHGLAVWAGEDGSSNGVFGRRLSSSGQPQGVDFQVNQYTTGQQLGTEVAAAGGVGFVVVWQSQGQDSSLQGVFARRFNAAGDLSSAELQVNSYVTGGQSLPAVAALGGDVVVAWTSEAQDGDEGGIFGQRFGGTASIDVDGDGAALPLTDGLLILRFLFGFTGNTLVTGAVNLGGCTRCTAPAIEAYLATLF